MGELAFRAELMPRGNASAVVLTDEQVAIIGEGAKRFPVLATINGHSWRTSVARMSGESLLGLSRAIRDGAAVEIGDTVDVHIALDTAPREVEVPPALAAALDADPAAKARYEALAFTHRKEYARWIAEAKKEETRERRVVQAIEMINAGQTRS